ncbi:MAG: NUDIX hydrolase [Candidatus Hydrothermia bacterium]
MKIIKRELKFKGSIFEVWREYYEFENVTIHRDIVAFPETCAVLPITEDGHAILITQYRAPVKREILEIPAGKIDPGETPEEAAIRELREEIKMETKRLIKIGSFYLSPGYSTEKIHIYIGLDLSENALPHDFGEDIKIKKFPLSELEDKLKKGEIEDAKTAIAILYYIHLFSPGINNKNKSQ